MTPCTWDINAIMPQQPATQATLTLINPKPHKQPNNPNIFGNSTKKHQQQQ